MNTRPIALITPSGRPSASRATNVPRPGAAEAMFSGRSRRGSAPMYVSASRLSHTWLPVVMTSTPHLSSASPVSRVMPAPDAAFSTFAMTASMA